MLSITHHALSPPPSHHHMYIIHLIYRLQRFYRITMSLKRPFVPKSDVKQRFTTTVLPLSTTSDNINLKFTMVASYYRNFFNIDLLGAKPPHISRTYNFLTVSSTYGF